MTKMNYQYLFCLLSDNSVLLTQMLLRDYSYFGAFKPERCHILYLTFIQVFRLYCTLRHNSNMPEEPLVFPNMIDFGTKHFFHLHQILCTVCCGDQYSANTTAIFIVTGASHYSGQEIAKEKTTRISKVKGKKTPLLCVFTQYTRDKNYLKNRGKTVHQDSFHVICKTMKNGKIRGKMLFKEVGRPLRLSKFGCLLPGRYTVAFTREHRQRHPQLYINRHRHSKRE